MMHAHPWCQRLLTPLPDEQRGTAIAADDPQWERVETELVKLGSLAHSQIDLTAVAEQCLQLLESQTKDMRVLAQLLRCLQHPAQPTPFATALELLDTWLAHYWLTAWPIGQAQKHKLMAAIMRRFDSVLPRVAENATASVLLQLQSLALGLAERWRGLVAEKATLTDALVQGLQRAQQRKQTQAQAEKAMTPMSSTPTPAAATAGEQPVTEVPAGTVAITAADERGWRQTQLQVAALLVERQPDVPLGYCLRRNAIWCGITTLPMVTRGNMTPLAPVSPDRVEAYHSALHQADNALWQRIEQSLTLAPYWFEGHWLSAAVASRLGHGRVAQAMAEALAEFLQRLPGLRELNFSDGSPFLSTTCSQWLQSSTATRSDCPRQNDLAMDAANCRAEHGLAAALALLDKRICHLKEPRDRFLAELALADLLVEEGMKALATQHYQHLWQWCQRLGLMQWEPGMVGRLERLAGFRQK